VHSRVPVSDTELGMLTFEVNRHQADMAQTFKIIRGADMVHMVLTVGSRSWIRQVGPPEVLMTH
jgi:hypothetical protein